MPDKSSITVHTSWKKIAPFAILSLLSFACGVGILILIIANSSVLMRLGFVGNFYYVALLPLGLFVAGFLFGVLRSYAYYSGNQLGGTLELGGPIVAFALVVIGGFVLPKPQEADFSVTAYVHGEAGQHDLVLRNAGLVWITLGVDRRHERIGEKGEANFKGIPIIFRGQEVLVWIEAEMFESVNPNERHLLESNIYLEVRYKSAHVIGRVVDEQNYPVHDAIIQLGNLSTTTDSSGRFSLTMSADRMQHDLTLNVLAPMFKPWSGQITANANEAVIILYRLQGKYE